MFNMLKYMNKTYFSIIFYRYMLWIGEVKDNGYVRYHDKIHYMLTKANTIFVLIYVSL